MSNKNTFLTVILLGLVCAAFVVYLHLKKQSKPTPKTFVTDSYFLSQDDVAQMQTKIEYAEEKTNYVLEQIIELEQRIEDLEP